MTARDKALGAWRGVEGEDQNTTAQGGEPIMTSIQQNEMIREWAISWAAKRAELEAELVSREEFQAWASEQMAHRSWTIGDCIARTLDQEDWRAELPSFPQAAAPSWVRHIDDSLFLGGELTVMVYGSEHRHGKASARMSWGLNVVVGPNGQSLASGVDEPIGTFAWFEGGPDIAIDQFADISWRETASAAAVLRELADEMRVAAAEELAA